MKILKFVMIATILAIATGVNAQVRIHAKSPVGILSMKVVQQELKLTEEQIAMVNKKKNLQVTDIF